MVSPFPIRRSGAARRSARRFVLLELALWASLYPLYLAVRGFTIGDRSQAIDDATRLVDFERAFALCHEAGLQRLVGGAREFFSAYYMIGFGPLLASALVWLGLRHRHLYRRLRTLLFVSVGLALFLYVFYPTAPPRLVPALGIADTVGLSAHDTGSFAGIRFNPYAAMPSMHVGWSLLVALVAFRAVAHRRLRWLVFLHPLLMAVTVTATGNHYFVDSAAGALVALTATGLVAVWNRAAAYRAHRSDPGGELVVLPLRTPVEQEERRAA